MAVLDVFYPAAVVSTSAAAQGNTYGIVHYVAEFMIDNSSWRTKHNNGDSVEVVRTLCGTIIEYAWQTNQPRRPCVNCTNSRKKDTAVLVVTLAGPLEVTGQLWSVTGDDSRGVPGCREGTDQETRLL